MTCVFSAPVTRCELEPSLDDARFTPDTDGCHPACVNTCRTEGAIDELLSEAVDLRIKVADEATRRSADGAHTREHLDTVAAELNSRPRKALGWETPAERLHKILAA
ncbi:hypothetical protein ACIQFZ_04355 [Streptomyces sp. NPDC093064]|uniref:hypothetical protein n=1 Tax=Streptomyces sp. NPDC093064 TaxID=3366020 RepID=UPI0037F2F3BE